MRGAGDDDDAEDDDDKGLGDDDDEDLAAALGTTARATTHADRDAAEAFGIHEAGRLVDRLRGGWKVSEWNVCMICPGRLFRSKGGQRRRSFWRHPSYAVVFSFHRAFSRTWRQQQLRLMLLLCACWWERARCIVAAKRGETFSLSFFIYRERRREKGERGENEKKNSFACGEHLTRGEKEVSPSFLFLTF